MIRQEEEEKIAKKYIITHKKADLDNFEFVDCCWDLYNNIYVGLSTNEIFLLNGKLNEISAKFKEETRQFIQLPDRPANLVITQRFLLCSMENGKIIFINPYFPPNELSSFKSMLGGEDKYEVFTIEKDVFVNNLGITLSMNWDLKFQKLYVTSKDGSLKIVPISAEILMKDKDKEEDLLNTEANSLPEVECFEEFKSHLYDLENLEGGDNWLNKVIGIREIPGTSQFLSIADDQKLIFWELSDLSAKVVNYLEYLPSCFEIDRQGNLLVTGSEEGVLRIYDISQKFIYKLIHQSKYLTREQHRSISRIIIHPSNKYICFCNITDNLVFFISGEVSNSFSFLGFIQTPSCILDMSLCQINNQDELIILTKQLLISYTIQPHLFIVDHKVGIKISNKQTYNIMNNFEIKFEPRARKIDSDLNYIVKHSIEEENDFIWLIGEDKMFRQYKLPSETLDSIKDNKRSPENPQDEMKGHDLNITDAESFGEYLISGSNDGMVQVRLNKQLIGQYRCESYLLDGVSCLSYSSSRQLIYTGGFDGSVFIFGASRSFQIPNDILNKTETIEELEIADSLEFTPDEELKSLEEIIHLEYLKLIRSAKKSNQATLKEMLEKLKHELNKIITENSREEEIEQLKQEEMIIDQTRISLEKNMGENQEKELNKQLFYELSEREIYKNKLYDKTYNTLLSKDSHGKVTNNNIKIFSNISGDKFLKSFPLRNFTEKERAFINHAKNLRIIELQEKYKRREAGIKEVIDESRFTNLGEEYLVNRISAQIELKEYEIPMKDILDNDDGVVQSEKAKFKVAKYKLQREPYENLGGKHGKQEESGEAIKYKPEEQLLKENLTIKYNTAIMKPADVDIKQPYKEIDTFSLLYSPFELYSTFRMRTQIFLILDIIQQLKLNFNKELKAFISEKNGFLGKFNNNKQQMELLKEILEENMEDEYPIVINQYEDNEWVNKFSELEITIPKYYSKEERELMAKEKLIEEERAKALQGDTLEMRGLKTMIAPQQKKKNENMIEDEELVKEPWMETKDTSKFTEDEMRKFNEYNKKKREIEDRREKIRSQNITKLNNIRMDMDNLKAEMESKFLKIMKKKLYFDYRITEQEMYVLSILRIQEYRQSVKEKSKNLRHITIEKKKVKEEYEHLKRNFEENYNTFMSRLNELDQRINDKNKMNKDANALLSEILSHLDLTKEDKEQLKEERSDPYYFESKSKLRNLRKYGPKKYNEIISKEHKSDIKELIDIKNQKFYYDYKKEKFHEHVSFIRDQYQVIESTYKNLDRLWQEAVTEDKKLKLNFDILIKIKRAQDEITDKNGPQIYVDQALLIDKFRIDNKNSEIDTNYTSLEEKKEICSNNKGAETENSLDLAFINLRKYDLDLKSRYLKLTRVTKKIQEIVTGREEINQEHIVKAYEQKKKNLEDNKKKRLKDIEDNLEKMKKEIERKKGENISFSQKYDKLSEDVKLKETIVNLDKDVFKKEEYEEKGGDKREGVKLNKKAKDLAQITYLKNLIQNYYEEIEFLRSSLDKARARTFPSFLQKPDQVIYPDEK
eukprot:CAMPEP_0170517338 /NCGR_PEP_ID=MMETSP0209-20121228/3359_1 /TAXON_ID=665100 ORGANISM="Litonotus pictus, Strain P1" /NCGR_SAMPLE_ID=MMETSP0209 /ASSEMBLY_ACC=CAM_ASM_000301 /LENGTH=1545 /DNA_ID=CAMNT_0010802563 /DNA_START=763 /DNA_END=5400 /DNA_ORIENTATION=-